MNIALFAGRQVGFEVAKFFAENNEPLACLVLDSRDLSGLNTKIIRESGIAQERVFYSHVINTSQTLAAFQKIELDLVILAWWPYIIKEDLINIPRIGCLNFHPSYLPYNRGKHYNFWAIVESVPFGVTLHFVNKGVDTGDIAFQSIIETSWEDTGETLYYKAQKEIIRLFKDKFLDIKSGCIPRKPQDLSQGSFHRSDELEARSQVDLAKNYTGRELLNLLRARTFPPHPGAWFIDKGRKYQIRIEITEIKNGEGIS